MRTLSLFLLCIAASAASAQSVNRSDLGAPARTETRTDARLGGLVDEDFEGGEPALPSGWTATNVNGDDRTWATQTNPDRARTGSGFAVVYWNVDAPADDWLFTPAVTLTANTSYTLDLWFRPGEAGPGTVESFEIATGASATVAAMTQSLYRVENTPGGPYQRIRRTFVADATGPTVIGFHCFSPADQFYCGIDDVRLTETPSIAVLDATPSSVDFGLVSIGASASARITLRNTGTQPLSIVGIGTSEDFLADMTGLDGTLAPEDTTSFQITFAPSANGPRSGFASIDSDAPGSPLRVQLSGIGGGPFTATGTTAGGPTFARPRSLGDGTSGSCALSPGAGNVPYQTLRFSPAAAGPYRITARWTSSQDGYLLLYDGAFDAVDPCARLVARNDDGSARANSIIESEPLLSGQPYTLVLTGFSDSDAGTYELEIVGPGAITTASSAEAPSAEAMRFSISPNPARGRTTLRLASVEGERVRIEAFDTTGRRIAALFDGVAGASRDIEIDTSAWPAGVYGVRVQGETTRGTQRITVVR